MFLDNVVTQVIVAEGGGDWQEYIGGYTDWERVRAAAAAKPATPKPDARAPAREATPAPKAKKLSYKEQRELDELPLAIAALEAEQKTISAKLADADIYHAHSGTGTPAWGRRVYYSNTHRQGGDYAWHKDNLSAAAGAHGPR